MQVRWRIKVSTTTEMKKFLLQLRKKKKLRFLSQTTIGVIEPREVEGGEPQI